jgi:glycosyltransferase involved in cell wall biosynthesis
VKIIFYENISDIELLNLYSRAKCMAYAPIREPFGLVPLEAMAAGTPVVAVNEGGVQETIIDGISGLVTDRNPEAFGEAIQKIVSNPDYAESLGESAHHYVVEKWSWDQHINRLEHIMRTTTVSYS